MVFRTLLIIALLTALYYAQFIFNFSIADTRWLYFLLTLAEAFTLSMIFGLAWTSLHYHHPKLTRKGKLWKKELLKGIFKSKVVVLIPTYGEGVTLVEDTIKAVLAMQGTKQEVYLLDDAKNPKMKIMAGRNHIHYMTRPDHKLSKAGNLRHTLHTLKHVDYVVVFDCDHKPSPNFLIETIPHMANPKVGMVQIPQAYYNQEENFITRGAGQIQSFFYKHVMPGKNSFNAAFCVGTNVVYRKQALDDIGGIAAKSHSEDVWTSRKLHEHGWLSIFVPKTLAFGLTPANLPALFNQQYRWSWGGIDMLFHHNALFDKRLTIDQKIQYFLSNSFYLSGIATLIYLFIPLSFLLFGIYPIKSSEVGSTWLVHYIPFFIAHMALMYYASGRNFFPALCVGLSLFPVYIRATLACLFQKDFKWKVTHDTSEQAWVTQLLFYHYLIVAISVIAIFTGIMTIGYTDPITTATSMVWAAINTLIIMRFIIASYTSTKQKNLNKNLGTKKTKLQLALLPLSLKSLISYSKEK